MMERQISVASEWRYAMNENQPHTKPNPEPTKPVATPDQAKPVVVTPSHSPQPEITAPKTNS